MLTAAILGGVLLVAALWGVGTYNGLVRGKNLVAEAWSGIDVQLKRRHDLIPNLVETVKAYAAHEREIFERIAALRSASLAATTVEELEPVLATSLARDGPTLVDVRFAG